MYMGLFSVGPCMPSWVQGCGQKAHVSQCTGLCQLVCANLCPLRGTGDGSARGG